MNKRVESKPKPSRVCTKIGDIFSVKIDDAHKKYFQLIAFDSTQLNSDVIRAFKTMYPIEDKPFLSDIVSGEVEFYAHCVTNWGVKSDHWEKVGHFNDVGNIDHILFRLAADDVVKAGETMKEISTEWYVWHIGDEDFTDVGKLTGENCKAELGSVKNPSEIVSRMQTGKYKFLYPGF